MKSMREYHEINCVAVSINVWNQDLANDYREILHNEYFRANNISKIESSKVNSFNIIIKCEAYTDLLENALHEFYANNESDISTVNMYVEDHKGRCILRNIA